MTVVDASLATKWLIQEANSDRADQFFVDHFAEMHAPELFLIEVAGAIVSNVNQRRITAAQADAGVAELVKLTGEAVILHRVTPELVASSARLAIALGHPLKDCIYLALADQLGCPLVTCDAKFRDRVGDPARVRLLAEMA